MDTMNKKIKDERHRSMAKLIALAERDGEEIIIISAQRGGAVRVSGSSTAHDLVMLWKATATTFEDIRRDCCITQATVTMRDMLIGLEQLKFNFGCSTIRGELSKMDEETVESVEEHLVRCYNDGYPLPERLLECLHEKQDRGREKADFPLLFPPEEHLLVRKYYHRDPKCQPKCHFEDGSAHQPP